MKMKWLQDGGFRTVARLAWPEDWAFATSKCDYGPDYSRWQAARSRMKHRYDGWRALDVIEAKGRILERRAKVTHDLTVALCDYLKVSCTAHVHANPKGET